MADPASPPSNNPPNDAEHVTQKAKTPIFVAVLNECNANVDQVQRRQKLITEIEEGLTKRYGTPNRLMSYVLRFGHARTMMNT